MVQNGSTDGPTDELVTVVIPALDEERAIEACLDSVLAQHERRMEVLVVDGGSTDRTRSLVVARAMRDPRVRLLHNPQRTIPHALNVGLAAARGRWLVRVDAHSTIPPDYVGRAVGHLRGGAWGGVGGRKDAVAVSATGRAVAAAMASRFGVGGSVYHHGVRTQTVDHVPFGAYPTALARSLGGWDTRLLVNEDFEFDQRIRASGRELLFDPELVIAWRCRESVADLFRQYRRYGRGKLAVARLHPRSVRIRHLAAPALVVLWCVAALLATAQPAFAAALMAPYLVGLAVASLLTARTVAGRRAKLAVAAAFVAMHAGWGIGFWEGVPLALRVSSRRASPIRPPLPTVDRAA